jgi:para-aminobenzoate synthetase/4-amino-4-deoxychorismate lyase
MTSTITGELRPDIGFHQVFRALFPSGSITGAPKIRGMQLLAQIEQQLRGVYTGAIGFFSRDQSVFNVAIRTLELDEESGDLKGPSREMVGKMGVGSGIVIDSNPAAEYRECLLKTEFLTSTSSGFPGSSARFSLIESLLWRGGYPLIELHLDRLEDSADYFGFPCDRAEAKAVLLAHAATFTSGESSAATETPGAPDLASEIWGTTDLNRLGAPSLRLFSSARVGSHASQFAEVPRKVRLLLDPEGKLHIESEVLPASAINPKPARIRIAPERTDPRDPMLFHKTTHRPLYTEALKAAAQAGFEDALFLNTRGEITEGAINNIFIEKDGRLLTPPVDCGLLAGVQRRHLLETLPNVEEQVLTLQDLRQADAIYLSNAVRGLRPATIDYAFATSTSVE